MKRFFAIFSLCAVLALSGCKKDDPAIVDELEDLVEVGELVEFSDSNFKQALITSGYDLNRDGEISVEEALKVTEIIVTGEKIKSLAGLEYFENLEVLQCSDTFLTEIDPFQNTKLREIVCNGTEVTVLDVMECPDIETIYADTVMVIFVKTADQEESVKISAADGCKIFVGDETYSFPDENFRLALLSSKNNIDIYPTDGEISMAEVRMATAIDITPDVATSFTNSLIYNVNSISSISSAETKSTDGTESAESTEAATTPKVTISTSENNLVLASAAVTRATGSGAGYVTSMKLDDFVNVTSLKTSGNNNLTYVDMSNNPKIEEVELPASITVVVLSEVQHALESFVELITEAVVAAVSQNEDVAVEDVVIASTAEGIFDKIDIDDATKSAIEDYLINNIKDDKDEDVVNGYDTNGDGVISYGESGSIKSLKLDDNANCTISGVNTALKLFTNLETLSFKQSTSAKDELVVMYNPLLKSLTMQAPNVSLLNLTNNTALTSVDTQNATGVTALNLSYVTALSSLDITGMEKLTFFGLGEVKQSLFEAAYDELKKGSNSTLATLGVSKISDVSSSLDLSTLGEFTALSYVAIPDAKEVTASQWQIDNYTSTWSLASDAVISLDMDQPMVFADTEFSAYAKALTEADGDSKLTPAEAKTVTSIDFKSEAYSAFAATAIVELKYFTGLTSLNLNGQSTFASTPDFSAEPYEGLTYLNISGTSVSEMDLTKTTLLKELYCTTDGIKSLNVSTNADLAVLEAESVKTLTVSQGQYDGTERDSWKLADGCVFETPELLPTDGLTFSSEVFKQYLITNNAIDTTDDDVITVAEAAAATAIDLSNLGSEDLATITKLSELRYFTGLTSLNLSGCTGLTAVDLTPCTLLTSVDLTDTKVTSLDISKIVNPTNITAPTVTTVAVSAAQYNLKDTTYAETWKFDAAVVYEVDGNLYKNVTFIEGEDETNNRAYVEALIAANEGLDSNKDNVVMESEVEEYAGVLTLPTAYTETDLTEIPQLAAFVKITGVVADSSTITSVDLSANTAVATLSLTNTSALSSLTTGTAMTSLTIGDGSALTTLDLSLSTLLTSIEITGATTLAELDLSACTALTSIEITGATTLAVLDLSACTALTSIEITGATTLASVTLPAASLTTLILDGNTSLTTVDLRSLTTLPAASSFSANASTKLYITGTQAAAVTPSEYLEKLAAAATAIYPTYDATTGTLTVVCDSTGDYEVDSYGVATTGDLLVQINGFDEVKSLYDNGVIEKLVISGVINHGDIRTALNHFYEMDFREVTNLYGKYMSSDSAASGTDKALNTNWPFKPFGDETLMKRITLSAYITTYANQAVGSCASVEEITIPAKATDIKWGAFTTCSMLNKVTYEEPAVVTILSGSTFKTSTLLKEVTLPSSLVTMGSMEFQNSGLTSIEIPAGVTTIGASCFDGCTDLTEVKVNWTNADATFTFTTPETFFPSNFHIGGDNYITIPDDYAGDAYEELALTYQMKTESGGQYYPAAYGFTNEAFAAAVKAVIEDPYQWTEAALAAMTELDLSGYADIANVTDATDLAVFVALETLNLSGAGISELDLSDNTALTSLTISNMASLATLDISMLDGLAVTAITAESSALTYITMTETQYNADATAAQALLKSGSDTSYIYTDGGDQLYPSTDSNIVFSNDFAASESYTYDAAAEAKELTVTAGSSLDDLKWFTSLETLTIESGVTAEEINLEDHNSLETLTISATGITTLDISATQIDEASSLSATYVMTLYTSSTNQGIDDSNYTEWLADTVLATDAVIYVDSAYAYPFKPYSEIDDERAAIAAKITGFMIGDTSYGASDLDTELKSNVLDEVVSLSLDGDLTDTQIAMVVSDFTALTTLSIANNSSMTALNVASLSLTEIEVTGCTSLESVTLESDAVFTTLKFSGNTALTTLDLSTLGAPLPAVANFNADSVTTLTISEAQAMSDENYALYHAELAADAKIYVSGDSIAVYPIAMYSEDNSAITAVITGFTLSGEAQTDVDLITVKNLGEVTALTLEGDLANSYVGQIFTDFVNLTSIVMTGNTTVTAIDMSTTKITSVEITGATALTSLILADGADMTKLEVTGCTELTTLNLRNISTLPEVDNFSATSVTTLEITGAQVTALGGDAAVLTDKLAADAKIDVEGVVQPPMVDGEIWISNEYLQSVIKATSGFSDKISDSGVMTATDAATVTTLVLSEITDETGLNDDLKYLTGLTSFTASGTSTTYGTALTSLDFSNNTSLTTLAMAYQTNLASVTGLDKIPTLSSIALNHTAITSFTLGATNTASITTTSLQNCTKMETVDLTGCTATISMLNLNNISSYPTVILTGASGLVQIKGNTNFTAFDVSDCSDSFKFNTLKKGAITEKLTLNTTQFADNKSDVTTADSSYVWTDLLADGALLYVEQADGSYKVYDNSGTEQVTDVILMGTTLYVSNVASTALTNDAAGTEGGLSCYDQNTLHAALVSGESTSTRAAAVVLSDVNTKVQAALDDESLSSDYLDTVTKIVVTGKLNAADFSYLFNRFEEVDLSGATMGGWSSAQNGTGAKEYATPFRAMYQDTKLKKFSTPSDLKTVGYQSFNTTGLTDCVLASSVYELMYYAFNNCTSLVNLNLSSSITAFTGGSSLYGCSALPYTSYSEMGLGVTAIKGNVFNGWTNLQVIDLPSTITEVGNSAFANCSNVTEISLLWASGATVTLGTTDPFPMQFKNGNENGYAITIPEGCSADESGVYFDLDKTYALKEAVVETVTFSNSAVQSAMTTAFGTATPTEAEVQGVTALTLDFESDDTTDLATDLEEFTALTSLTLSGEITAFDPVELTNLAYLDIDESKIKSLDLTSNTAIVNSANVVAVDLTSLTLTSAQYEASQSGWQDMLAVGGTITVDGVVVYTKTDEPAASTLSYDATTKTLTVTVASTADDEAYSYDETTVSGSKFPTSGDLLKQITTEMVSDLALAYDYTAATDGTPIEKLVISGTINAGDYKTIYGKFKSVDMSGVTQLVGSYQSTGTAVATSESTDAKPYTYITYNAFLSDSTIAEFISPSNVKLSYGYIFKSSTALKSFTYTSGEFEEIDWGSFDSCSLLTTFTIGEGCTKVNFFDGSAFASCSSLDNVTLPSTTTKMGKQAFKNCTSLSSIELPASVYQFNGGDTQQSFYGCTNLNEIKINWTVSDGVLKADGTTVAGVNSTTFPVEYLVGGTKYITSDLTNEDCVGTLLEIYNVGSIKQVVTLQNAAVIAAIKAQIAAVENPLDASISDAGMMLQSDAEKVTSLTISTITEEAAAEYLNDDLALLTALTSLDLSGSTAVTSLDLSNNTALSVTNVTLGSTLSSLVLDAVQYDDDSKSAWQEMVAGDGGVISSSAGGVLYPEITSEIYDGATGTITIAVDSNTTDYANVDITTSIQASGDLYTEIAKDNTLLALYNTSTIAKLVISGVVNSHDIASMVNHFTEIDMSGVTSIVGTGNTASKVYAALGDQMPFEGFSGDTTLTTLTLSSTLTSYRNKTVAGATALVTVNTPCTTGAALGYGFAIGCTSLKNVNISSTKYTTMSGATFSGCTALESFTIPATTTTMVKEEFKNCSALTSINIPASVVTMGSYSATDETWTNDIFTGCTNLTEITLNWDGTEELDDMEWQNVFPSQFYKESGSYSITIPDNYTGIKVYETLYETYNLVTVSGDAYVPTVPVDPAASVIEVVGTATGDAKETIGTEPSTLAAQFADKLGADYLENANNGKVTITGTINGNDFLAIKAANFEVIDMGDATSKGYIVTNPSGSTSYNNNTVPAGAFSNATSKSDATIAEENTVLKEVVLPSAALYYGEALFANCTALERVTFAPAPATDTAACNLMNYGLYGCTSLTEIVNMSAWTHLGSYAVAGCTALKSIDLSCMTTKIGASAFSGCSQVTEVVSLGSAIGINANAFDGTLITTLTIPATCINFVSKMLAGAEYLTSVTMSYDSESVPDISALTNVFPTSFTSDGLSYILVTSDTKDLYTEAKGWSTYNVIDDIDDKPTATPYEFENDSFQTAFENENGTGNTVQDLAAMDTLELNDSSITDFSDLAAFTGLTTLDLSGCTGATDTTLDLSANTALTSLDVSDSNFTELTLTYNTQLAELDLSNTAIESIDLSTTAMAATGLTASGLTNITLTADQFANTNDGWYEMLADGGKVVVGETEYTKPVDADASITVVANSTSNDTMLGTLASAIAGSGAFENYDTYTTTTFEKIIVTGSINAADFAALRGRFVEIDLTGATVVGTIQSNHSSAETATTQSGNAIPYGAFSIQASAEAVSSSKEIDAEQAETVLKKISLPKGVTKLGEYVFHNATALETVVFTDAKISALSMSAGTFFGATSLKNINTEVITNLASYYVFQGCSSLETADLSSIAGPITGHAFRDCTRLSSVTLGDGVTGLIQYAFYGCSSLKSLVIPNSKCTQIQANVIDGTAITEIDIPATVTTWKNNAFKNAASLTKITLNYTSLSSVTSATNMFPTTFATDGDNYIVVADDTAKALYAEATNWSSYQYMTVAEYEEYLASGGGAEQAYTFADEAFGALEAVSGKTASELAAMTELDLSDQTGISDFADLEVFTGLTSLNVSGCTTLTSLTTSIYTSLSYLDVTGSGVTSLDLSGNSAITSSANVEAVDLTSLTLTADQYADSNSGWQAMLAIDGTITVDGVVVYTKTDEPAASTLSYDATTKTLTVTVASTADDEAYSYDETTVSGSKFPTSGDLLKQITTEMVSDLALADDYIAATEGTPIEKLVISGTINAGDYKTIAPLFQEVDMSGVTQLVGSFLSGSSTVSDSESTSSTPYTYLPYSAFSTKAGDLTSIVVTDVTLPANLYGVLKSSSYPAGANAFMDTKTLTNVTFTSGDFTELDWAFASGASNLTSVDFGECSKITVIDGNSFASCSNLNNVTIPSNVTTLGYSAFKSCTSLTSIEIPASVNKFPINGTNPTNTFYNCSKLDEIKINWTVESGVLKANGVAVTLIDDYTFPSEYLVGGTKYITSDLTNEDCVGTLLEIYNVGSIKPVVTLQNAAVIAAIEAQIAAEENPLDASISDAGMMLQSDAAKVTSLTISTITEEAAVDYLNDDLALLTGLTSLDLSGSTAVTSLDLSGNSAITSSANVVASELTNITLTQAQYDEDTSDWQAMIAEEGSIYLSDDETEEAVYTKENTGGTVTPDVSADLTVSNSALKSYIETNYASYITGGVVAEDNIQYITTLDLSTITVETGLQDDINKLTGLTSFTASGTSTTYGTALTSLDFSNNTSLTTLAMAYQTNLTSVTGLDKIATLSSITLNHTAITSFTLGATNTASFSIIALQNCTKMETVDLTGCTATISMLNLNNISSYPTVILTGASGLVQIKGNTNFTAFDVSDCSDSFKFNTLKKGAITEKLTLNTTQFADNKSDVTTADSSYVWTDLLADDALLAVEQSGDEGEVTYKYYNNTGAETDSEGTVLDTGSGEGGDDGEGNEPDTTTLSVVLDGTTLTVSNVASVALNNSVKGTLTDGVDQTCYTVCTNHVALTAAEGEDIETARTTAMAELSGINNAVQAAITAETLSSDYLSTATKIVVTGEVNAADFSYLYERFSEIDLSGATFVGYGSAGNASNATLACIPFAAFYMDTVTTKFSTPSNTEVFGNRVFHLATSLTDVTLATTVKELKYWAFYDCTKLANINLDDAVIATVGDGVFYNCNVMNYTSYSEMKLSITTIGYQTFLGCKLLETLDLTEDDGITTIRQQSFKNCTGLTSVNIPSTVTTIAPTNDTTTTLNTFDGCTALATVTLNWDADDTISISYPENLFPSQFFKDSGTASITIPDGVTNVAIYNTLADTYSLKHENGGAYVTTYVFADENFGTAFSAAYGGYSTASAAELATIETLSLDSADITSFADVAAFTGLTSLTLDGCTGCTELDITASASLTSVSAPSVTKLTMTAAQATTFNVTKGVDATHSESLTLAEGYSIYVDGVCFAGVD